MMTRKCPKSDCFVICNGDCLHCERTYFGGKTDLEYIENTGTQYIDTGVAPDVECKPCTLPVLGFRVYDGDVLIHDCKPCRNREGVEGMWDYVDNVFIPVDEFSRGVEEFYKSAEKLWIE